MAAPPETPTLLNELAEGPHPRSNDIDMDNLSSKSSLESSGSIAYVKDMLKQLELQGGGRPDFVEVHTDEMLIAMGAQHEGPIEPMSSANEDQLRAIDAIVAVSIKHGCKLSPPVLRNFVEVNETVKHFGRLEGVYNLSWLKLLEYYFPASQGFEVAPQWLNIYDPSFDQINDSSRKQTVDFVVVYRSRRGRVPVLLLELKPPAGRLSASGRCKAYKQVRLRRNTYTRLSPLSQLFIISAFGCDFAVFSDTTKANTLAYLGNSLYWRVDPNSDEAKFALRNIPWRYNVTEESGNILVEISEKVKTMVRETLEVRDSIGDVVSLYERLAAHHRAWMCQPLMAEEAIEAQIKLAKASELQYLANDQYQDVILRLQQHEPVNHDATQAAGAEPTPTQTPGHQAGGITPQRASSRPRRSRSESVHHAAIDIDSDSSIVVDEESGSNYSPSDISEDSASGRSSDM